MSHITLIRPPMIIVREVPSRSCVPPIGLAYIASSLLKEGHIVDAIDAVGEDIFSTYPVHDGRYFAHGLKIEEIINQVNPNSDILGVSCMFSHEWPLAYNLIKKLHNCFPSKTIVVGGEHVTATAEELLNNCPEVDYCVLGEGEVNFSKLIIAINEGHDISHLPAVLSKKKGHRIPIENGFVDHTLRKSRIKSVDDIPTPAWDLFPIKEYLNNGFGHGVQGKRSLPFVATRGCPYQCAFCSSPQMWTTSYKTRKTSLVIEEMEGYFKKYKVNNFGFCDLTTVINKRWIIEYCSKLIEKGSNFTYQFPNGTRSEAIDSEVASLMYRSGCRSIYYAPESGSPTVLKKIRKKVDLKKMKCSMRSSIKSGIVVKANIVTGFPGETHYEILQTIMFIWHLAIIGVHDVTIAGFIPYPGSEFYKNLIDSKKIELSDEYLLSLASTTNRKQTTSWSEHISNKHLHWYKLYGLISFYLISYSIRPWRFFKVFYNAVNNKPDETRMESVLRSLFNKIFSSSSIPEVKRVKITQI